jgi:hypothetical protein
MSKQYRGVGSIQKLGGAAGFEGLLDRKGHLTFFPRKCWRRVGVGVEVISKKIYGLTKNISGHITFFPENEKNFLDVLKNFPDISYFFQTIRKFFRTYQNFTP